MTPSLVLYYLDRDSEEELFLGENRYYRRLMRRQRRNKEPKEFDENLGNDTVTDELNLVESNRIINSQSVVSYYNARNKTISSSLLHGIPTAPPYEEHVIAESPPKYENVQVYRPLASNPEYPNSCLASSSEPVTTDSSPKFESVQVHHSTWTNSEYPETNSCIPESLEHAINEGLPSTSEHALATDDPPKYESVQIYHAVASNHEDSDANSCIPEYSVHFIIDSPPKYESVQIHCPIATNPEHLDTSCCISASEEQVTSISDDLPKYDSIEGITVHPSAPNPEYPTHPNPRYLHLNYSDANDSNLTNLDPNYSDLSELNKKTSLGEAVLISDSGMSSPRNNSQEFPEASAPPFEEEKHITITKDDECVSPQDTGTTTTIQPLPSNPDYYTSHNSNAKNPNAHNQDSVHPNYVKHDSDPSSLDRKDPDEPDSSKASAPPYEAHVESVSNDEQPQNESITDNAGMTITGDLVYPSAPPYPNDDLPI